MILDGFVFGGVLVLDVDVFSLPPPTRWWEEEDEEEVPC